MSIYYISPSGSDSIGLGTSVSPWATLKGAFTHMASGDTLICKDGTYTGNNNIIDSGGFPPYGTVGAYTVVKAENDGMAIFSGDTMIIFYATGQANKYWQFEGLIWCNSGGDNLYLGGVSYVKFLRCGAYDAGDGNNSNITTGQNSSYLLFENCYVWGNGRYKFNLYMSNHIILRQCVARLDRDNAISEPIACYSVYSCDDIKLQNCIAIDTDQTSKYINVEVYGGPFLVPSTSKDANRVEFNRCIALNVKIGGFNTTGNEYYVARDVVFRDCVLWDCAAPGGGQQITLNMFRGLNDQIINCTFGVGYSDYILFNSYDSGIGQNTTIKNSIIYAMTGSSSLFSGVESASYNDFYANTGSPSGSNNKLLNPIYNISTNPIGALKYITRVELGSNLAGQGEAGADIGANIKTLIGTSGTIWGQTGYNTDTGISMWPFPNEDLIRTKMKAYNAGGVSGNRGFCVDQQTLTRYIWEYLGNPIPADIYGPNPATSISVSDSISIAESRTLSLSMLPSLSINQYDLIVISEYRNSYLRTLNKLSYDSMIILEIASLFVAGVGDIAKAEYIIGTENVSLFDTLKLELNLP